MRCAIATGLAVMLCGADLCAQEPEPWDALLAQIGLTRQTAQLAADRWREGGRGRLGSFERLWDDWSLIEPTERQWAAQVLTDPGNLGNAILWAAERLDAPLTGPPVGGAGPRGAPASPRRLAEAIASVHLTAGQPLDGPAQTALVAESQRVPEPLALAAAVLLEACPAALACRNKAFAACGSPEGLAAFGGEVRRLATDWDVSAETLALLEQVDMGQLLLGAAHLARAMDEARSFLPAAVHCPRTFRWETPLGRIVIGSSRDGHHPAADYLLLLDAGGNDIYRGAGGTPDPAHPISMVLDLGGDDHYESDGEGTFGAGLMGYGLLVDAAGNDTYRVQRLGLGAGIGGVGLLLDLAGDDTYIADSLSEAAAVYGVGFLADLAGRDQYQCYTMSQALGGMRGCGLLVDAAGDDRYEANDTDIRYPSPQTAEHNVSLAQGAGFGRRAHPGDGRSLAGGVGLLTDGGGNDEYVCGVFGEGTAYWYSVGMLADMAGDDRYRGAWYVQGSSAHYAVAALLEGGGNDQYEATITSSQGFGHDYGTGVLADDAGDDLYRYSAALGRGNASGIGVVCDRAGSDRYEVPALAGSTTPERPGVFCLGLFADLGPGDDVFPPDDPLAKPHSMWVRPEPGGDRTNSWGLGMDQ